MAMSLSAMQTVEALRGVAEKDRNRCFAGHKGVQRMPAPAADIFDLFEDVHRRLKELEKERDARGLIEVGDPSKGLVDFVDGHIDFETMTRSDVIAKACIRALFGRVLYTVEKQRKLYEAEIEAAHAMVRDRGTVKDREWWLEVKHGKETCEKIEEQLRELLTGG